jgi:hypothetical protein
MGLEKTNLKFDNQNTQDMKDVLMQVSRLAARKSVEIVPFSDMSLLRLQEMEINQRKFLYTQLTGYRDLLAQQVEVNPGSLEVTLAEEIDFIHMALKKFSMKSLINDFSFVAQGDLVEIYSTDMIQLYRNLEFFKQCSYDLLTLVTSEWPTLYERAHVVTNQILKRAHFIMTEGKGITPYDVPVHTLKERYVENGRIFSVELKSMLPLVHEKTGERAGGVHSIGSTIMLNEIEAKKISYI